MYRSVGVALVALFITNAHATPAAENSRTVKVNGCTIDLAAGEYVPGSALIIRPTTDLVADALLNKPVELTKTEWSPIYETNRDVQMERAREVAKWLADQILAPGYLDNEKGQIKIQDILTTQLGALPDGALAPIENILTANLSSISDKTKRPEYRVKTDNALSDLTATVTSYRKSAFDVNAIANLGNRLATIPLLNKLPIAKELPELFRQRFQSVLGAIQAIGLTFTESLAQMRLRHEQMGSARLDLKVLERYLELSQYIGEELRDLVQKHMDDSDMTKEQKASFTKIVVKPINARIRAIMEDQATVMASYYQFTLLMDGNLDLIGIIGNIRQTASLKLKTYGAGKILADEIDATKNLARDYYSAANELHQALIEQLKAQGISIRDTETMMIESTEQMMDFTGQLLAEMKVALEAPVIINEKIKLANVQFGRQLELLKKEGAKYDLIRATEKITDRLVPESRRGDAIEVLPNVPAVVPQ